MEDGSGAHGAGLEGGVEVAAVEAVVTEELAGGAEGDDLGMSAGVVIAEDTVIAGGDDLTIAYEDGTDGDFAGGLGGAVIMSAACPAALSASITSVTDRSGSAPDPCLTCPSSC